MVHARGEKSLPERMRTHTATAGWPGKPVPVHKPGLTLHAAVQQRLHAPLRLAWHRTAAQLRPVGARPLLGVIWARWQCTTQVQRAQHGQ